jgi:hypothetical protein
MVTTINLWLYAALVGSFVLGMFIGITIGKKRGMTDMLLQQQRMEATRLWTDTLKGYMEGKNGSR